MKDVYILAYMSKIVPGVKLLRLNGYLHAQLHMALEKPTIAYVVSIYIYLAGNQ